MELKEPEHIASFDENGNVILKKRSEVNRGRKSRASGIRFELKIRNDLEKGGWIVDKWTNNFDLENKKLVKAKRKYNPFKKMLVVGTGFPDFIAFRKLKDNHEVIGVEVKSKGYLDKEEKEKCMCLLENNIFSKILIAGKGKKRGEIIYKDFNEKLGIK